MKAYYIFVLWIQVLKTIFHLWDKGLLTFLSRDVLLCHLDFNTSCTIKVWNPRILTFYRLHVHVAYRHFYKQIEGKNWWKLSLPYNMLLLYFWQHSVSGKRVRRFLRNQRWFVFQDRKHYHHDEANSKANRFTAFGIVKSEMGSSAGEWLSPMSVSLLAGCYTLRVTCLCSDVYLTTVQCFLAK